MIILKRLASKLESINKLLLNPKGFILLRILGLGPSGLLFIYYSFYNSSYISPCYY